MLNWAECQKELLGHAGEVGQITSDTIKDCKTLSAAIMGSLGAKTRELIAPAVAVTTRCDGRITAHTVEAIKHGATHEEIADALSVATSLNVGAALAYSACALDAMQAYEKA